MPFLFECILYMYPLLNHHLHIHLENKLNNYAKMSIKKLIISFNY